jgi:hypothetical protein
MAFCQFFANFRQKNDFLPWWRGLVVESPPATEETEATGREIDSRRGIHKVEALNKKKIGVFHKKEIHFF